MVKEAALNKPQALIHAVNANKTYCMWGRGTGKSNGGLGPRSLHLFNVMPRAQVGLVCPSYTMAFKQIIPNIAGFWQNHLGLIEGEHYVIGKKPLEDWDKPLQPLFDHRYVISFDNGCVMPIISLEAEGPGNGLNLQALLGDEAKFFNEKRLKEVIRAVRGCHKEFGHLAEFQSQWYFTDKYEGNVQWMMNKRSLMKPEVIKSVLAMQIKLTELMDEYATTANASVHKRIMSMSSLLNQVRQRLVFVSEASAEENRKILGDKFFDDQKQDSTGTEYDIAILNEDPDRVENPFYQSLSEHNFYTDQYDCHPDQPLIIACDYQWRISPIVTAQYGILPNAKSISLNFIDSNHTLAPDNLLDAIDEWANIHKHHHNKLVYYLFDKTAVGKNPTNKPFFESVIERLTIHGWNVAPINMGEPPRHDDKFKKINTYLTDAANSTLVRINKLTNTALINSMKLTPAITYNGKTAKNKSSEKNLSYPAEKSTHYGDTFDMILHGCLSLDIVPRSQSSFGSISMK